MSQNVGAVEKLSNENYSTWCIQVRSLLITMDLWQCISEICPTPEAERAKWLVDDRRALATLTLCVMPSELIHIKNCTTSKNAWSVLHDVYKAGSASRKVSLFEDLVKFKVKGEKWSSQLNSFKRTIEDLKEVGIELSDDLVTIFLLCSLPDEMENFVVAIKSQESLLKIDRLIPKILEEERRKNDKNANVNVENVFAAKEQKKYVNGGTTKHSSSGFRRKIKCFHCGKLGHIRSQCRLRNQNAGEAACSIRQENVVGSDVWIFDSGATSHMCRDKKLFENIVLKNRKIFLATGKAIHSEGKGTVKLTTDMAVITLNNVLFVPDLHSNFFSVAKAIEYGNTVRFSKNQAVMRNKYNKQVLTAVLTGGMFIVHGNRNCMQMLNSLAEDDVYKWHRRFGHLNCDDMNKIIVKDMCYGFNKTRIKKFDCEVCATCKIHCKPHKSVMNIGTKCQLELIHTDLCGPIQIKSLGGAVYFVTFIDDYSRYIHMYLLKNKGDAFNAFMQFVKNVERQTQKKIKAVRSDNGKEYINERFETYFVENGINHQRTVSYTPQQNGVAERANRSLVEMVRCFLESSSSQYCLWGEAINAAVYIRNRSPTKILKNQTPYERWFGKKPSVSHLKVFGCDAVMLNKGPKAKGNKFKPKGIKLKFVGYPNHTKGYRLFNPHTKKIEVAHDVIFFENSFELSKPSTTNEDESVKNFLWLEDIKKLNSGSNENIETERSENDSDCSEYEESTNETGKRMRGRPKILRTGEPGRPRKIYCRQVISEMLNVIIDHPENVEEALASDEADHWKSAMNNELNSLIKNKTWSLVDKPDNKNIIGCRWVFAIKRNPNGIIEKYKARLVAQGCSQKLAEDYNETYAPVVRYTTIRLILAIAANEKMLVNHIDIVAAYLNGELKEEIYMQQPTLFADEQNTQKVCKLNKTLYGLKQAGREWNIKITDILLKMSFARCKFDSCVYTRKIGMNLCIIAVYVDDILLACTSQQEMCTIIADLNKHVEAIDRGSISFYLGMEIERKGDRGEISIHQSSYTEKLLKRWGMMDCKPASTPWASGTVLRKCDKNCENLNIKKYQGMIGGLMYLTVISRPDIAHVVSKRSQFNTHSD